MRKKLLICRLVGRSLEALRNVDKPQTESKTRWLESLKWTVWPKKSTKSTFQNIETCTMTWCRALAMFHFSLISNVRINTSTIFVFNLQSKGRGRIKERSQGLQVILDQSNLGRPQPKHSQDSQGFPNASSYQHQIHQLVSRCIKQYPRTWEAQPF